MCKSLISSSILKGFVLFCIFACFSGKAHATKLTQTDILPDPQVVSYGPTSVVSTGFNFLCDQPEFKPAIDAFLYDNKSDIHAPKQLVNIKLDKKLRKEEYKLLVGKNIDIYACSKVGLVHALATLDQLRGHHTSIKYIDDYPKTKFRCVMVDVARRYFSISSLKTLVKWCEIGKIRYLQLHLTDDQNWMFPTSVLAGADSHNLSHHKAYTIHDLLKLQNFAEARGVTIIPEVDMPGHFQMVSQVDPQRLLISGSDSTNCLNFASPYVQGLMKKLIKEVATVFPYSPYIHLGGDEAYYPNAKNNPFFKEAMQSIGPKAGPDDVFIQFLSNMADEVLRLNKIPIVWEGFGESPYAIQQLSKKVIVVAWDGRDFPAKKLIPDGFSVINAGRDPLYVVNHYPYDIFTVVPLEKLWAWNPNRFGFTVQGPNRKDDFMFPDSSQYKGAMMCWWEGYQWNALRVLPPRMLAFGARLWNATEPMTFQKYWSKYQTLSTDMNRSNFPFHVSVQGLLEGNPTEFVEKADINVVPNQKDVRIAIKEGGETPTLLDISSGSHLTIHDSAIIAVQAFKQGEPTGETQFLKLTKVMVSPNLALHCKVFTNASFDPQFPPSRVTDGVSDDLGSYWLAYPNPQILTIDLGKIEPINRIEVVACWANQSSAQFILYTSPNGKNFQVAVDASDQKTNTTVQGYSYNIPSRLARYVRIKTLKCGLYPSSMLRINEIRVFNTSHK